MCIGRWKQSLDPALLLSEIFCSVLAIPCGCNGRPSPESERLRSELETQVRRCADWEKGEVASHVAKDCPAARARADARRW